MFSFVLPLLMGQGAATGGAAAAAPTGPMAGIMQFAPFIAIIAIFYFLIIRPQNKKQKETQKMLEALKKGDKVITIGGLHGTISAVRDKTVVIKVDDNTKIEFLRSAVSTVTAVGKGDDEKAIEKSDDKSDEKSDDEKKE